MLGSVDYNLRPLIGGICKYAFPAPIPFNQSTSSQLTDVLLRVMLRYVVKHLEMASAIQPMMPSQMEVISIPKPLT